MTFKPNPSHTRLQYLIYFKFVGGTTHTKIRSERGIKAHLLHEKYFSTDGIFMVALNSATTMRTVYTYVVSCCLLPGLPTKYIHMLYINITQTRTPRPVRIVIGPECRC